MAAPYATATALAVLPFSDLMPDGSTGAARGRLVVFAGGAGGQARTGVRGRVGADEPD
jgi:hypothetical protein